ncbi:Solute carrier organic anion transporter family member 6A1 [Fukomys damarensis]|uniref:Solute carrier organic anion transporter family member 6A1 n=1 Tax=Fukomys damarensis TaxID=885580 RepID=A0A091E2F0_FUKDA|nr:Solute carrier organic anion transporter family member 6A1 [Fukomys damarensis]
MQRIPTLRPVTLESLEKEKFGPRPSRTANASQAEEEDAMIKFTRSSKKKRAKLSVLKKKEPQVVPGDPSEGPCGLGCITIACCQRFNSIRWFMAFYCVLLVSQGIVFGLIDLSNNDFEQHHILTITEQIALTLSYDVSSCLMVLFIAYYGGSGNRTKWIALSSFLVGLGSLLLAFPYFGGRKYKSQVKTEGTADAATILGYALGLALGAPQPKSSQNNTSPAESVVDYVGNVQQEKKWWLNFLFVSLLAWSTLLPFLCFPYSIAGTIPGPALFKITGETSCTFRDTNRCGYKGRCWVYNKTKMAFILMGMCKWYILQAFRYV